MHGDLLRIIDANANRAREALRMIEDYARFVLDDPGLCLALKKLRHELADALGPILPEAMNWRNTPGDMGTALKTPQELKRDDLVDVVTAAAKRMGEALRSIGEYLKTMDPAAASRVEAIRYRFYDLEQTLAQTLRPAGRMGGVRLYVLITESLCRLPWLKVAEEAICGGADCLQLREKEMEAGELLKRARQLVELCRRSGVVSIINDRPDIAVLSGADGVHIGQGDLPAREARKVIGQSKILGVSTHNLAQAKQAVLDGADYIGVGPTFKSVTKPRDFVAGCELARQAAHQIRIPAVAIAGITLENVDEVLACGIKAVAVTAAVAGCDDPRAAAARLKKKLVESAAADTKV
jgi:thiamine-phosphate pyrophosphorylase